MWKVIQIIGTVILAGFALMMQIQPDDAKSNLSAWLSLVTDNVPSSFISPTADKWALAVLVLAGFLLWFGPWLYKWLRKPSFSTEAGISQGLPQGKIDTVKGKKSFIPLIELRDEIKKLPGWELDVGLQYYDLMRAFREAANQGIFEVWGRQQPTSGVFLDDVISQKIPNHFWLEATIDLFQFPDATENEKVVTTIHDLHKRERMPIYFDLQVERAPAIEWAKVDAAKYRRQSSPPASETSTPSPIQKALKHNDWVLNFNPLLQGKHKRISFDDDGTIGKGRNENEYKWRINGPTLEIWKENDDLQNRFVYNARDERFICTNAPEAYGIPKQIIYRFKNQNGEL